MNGHRTPRRASARQRLLLLRQHPLSPTQPPAGPSPYRRFADRRGPLPLALALLLLAALLACTVALAGCESDATSDAAASGGGTFPVTLTDDNGATVTVGEKPMRIVSTAPASTEILFALGVGDRVVGVNSLDDYPPEVADIAKVGDFQVNTEAVMALSPDLVVGYSGNEEGLAPVQAAGAPVLILNPPTVEGIYTDITLVGAATGATREAAELVESIKAQIKAVTDVTTTLDSRPTVFYALDNTLWTCGPGSFVDELLGLAGAANAASLPGAEGTAAQAYYQLSPEQLIAADPYTILLPGSMYTSADEFTADARFAGLTAVKEGRVIVIDDVIVTRPGPRIGEGLRILAEAIHPGMF
jgi:iron complex transport system substrate-binding protein